MSAFKAAAFAAVSALLAGMLKKEKAEYALLVQAAAATAILLSALSAVTSVLQMLREIAGQGGLPTEYLSLMLRALCMAAAGEWAAAFCRDAGMSALALTAETATKIFLLSMCLPLMQTVLRFAAGFFI